MNGVLVETMDDSTAPTNRAFVDWRAEQRPVLPDNALLATPLSDPTDHDAGGRYRTHVHAALRRKQGPRPVMWNHLGNIARIPTNVFLRGNRRQHGCQRQSVRTHTSADWRMQQRFASLGQAVSIHPREVQCNGLAFGAVETNLAESCAGGANALTH